MPHRRVPASLPCSLLPVLLASCLAGCAHDRPGSTAALPAVAPSGRTVRDVVILSAVFGTGSTFVDVADRVAELLRTEPQGFTARSDWLRVDDPVPYKNKALVITYRHRGQERTFLATGDQRVSYDLLTAPKAP